MEKLSLYDLLSFLLPGAVCSILLYYRFLLPLNIELPEVNDQLEMVIFIAISFFIGSLIHYIFEIKLFEILIKKIGLYQPIPNIYHSKRTGIQKYVKAAFKSDLEEFKKFGFEDEYEQINLLWNKIYYKLEAEDKITTPKSFQSFYFFFRNIATLSIFTILFETIFFIFGQGDSYEIEIIGASIVILLLSAFAGRLHRRKMVNRMFYTYYSLYKFENK